MRTLATAAITGLLLFGAHFAGHETVSSAFAGVALTVVFAYAFHGPLWSGDS